MNSKLLYPIGITDSSRHAATVLEQSGFALTDHPTPEISHLLLDVPSFDPTGQLLDGSDLEHLLRMLPKSITIIGGNLDRDFLNSYQKIDLLKDAHYLARNAAITAECALQTAAPYLKAVYADSPALILGWGRIGKCLARLLSALGCPVTVAARKESDRAMLEALGYNAVDFPQVHNVLKQCTVLFNTVPDLPADNNFTIPQKNCIAIDLASFPGMQKENVIVARGLPGKYAPESSGKLIAESILRLESI